MVRSHLAFVAALVIGLAGTLPGEAKSGPIRGAELDSALETLDLSGNTITAVIVRLRPDHDKALPPEAAAIAVPERLNPALEHLKTLEGITKIRPFKLQPSFAAEVTPEGLEHLLSSPDILSIEIDDQWDLHTEEGMELIGADVLQLYGFSGAGSAVAVIDTGIDAMHPSLGGGEIPNPKVVRGLDTADNDDDPSDCSGHGTAVASIAAGVSVQWSPGRHFSGGVAPEARIFAYKAASDDNCMALTESAAIAAIEDAVLHREGDGYSLAAINISGGGGVWSGPCDAENPALATAVDMATSVGITVVASSGNDGLSTGIASPACIESVVAVGSVWDQNPSSSGSIFCLNDDCTRYCNDQEKLMAQPTCYSNSGMMLDLLAPSEYLRVAEAGGDITAFGGTSGAAPYVAGGIAILQRAYPDTPPAHLRHLLSTSSTLVTDPQSHRTFPLTDLVSALQPTGLHLAETLSTDLPPFGSGPLVSDAFVDSWGAVGSVELTLRITHPQPDALQISLRGPEGHEIRIRNGGGLPGSNEALIGTFPLDFTPIQSLNTFIGTERHGTWELVVEDLLSEDHTAQLESWSLRFTNLVPPSEDRSPQMTFLPVVARGPGAAGTWWTTDLQIFNPSPFTPVQGNLYLVREGKNGIADHLQRPVFIPAAAQVSLIDVVGETFGLNAGAGQLLIDTSAMPLVAGGTIATKAPSGGTFGQFEHGITAGCCARLVLPHITGGPDFRTNVGLSENAGIVANATLRVFDGLSGDQIGTPIDIEVQPFSIRRIDGILQTVGAPLETVEAFAVIETEAVISAWASIVDEKTGDAVFVPGTEPFPGDTVMIPVVARTSGVAGTRWRSDVHIVPSGEGTTNLELEFRPIGTPADLPMTASISIGHGKMAVLNDVVWTVFGLNEVAGTLRIINDPDNPKITVSSRTFNQGPFGTYGQSIPAVTTGSRGTGATIGINGSADQRSNLLVSEFAGESVVVEAVLRDRHGNPLGEPISLTIEAFGLVQLNDVFTVFGATPMLNCRIDIRRTAGQGSFFALASVVDHHTGDAVAIAMTEIE